GANISGAITGLNGSFSVEIEPGPFTWTAYANGEFYSGSGNMPYRGKVDLGNVTMTPVPIYEEEEKEVPALAWVMVAAIVALALFALYLSFFYGEWPKKES
ncbi:MAG: hypothetical protein KAT70_00675, partial [Thermoplasmata archaeon]|nr:hypothetical protein [Thermoplasmata archaeon]